MSSVIFSGDRLKALKNALKLSDKATIFSDNIDPTSTPFNAQLGDILISTLTGKTYQKTDNGLSTNWNAVATTADTADKANIELDNLGTTAINADLVPNADNSFILGSTANNWNDVKSRSITSNSSLNVNSTNGGDINITSNKDISISGDVLQNNADTFAIDTTDGSSFDVSSQINCGAFTSIDFEAGTQAAIIANAGNLTLHAYGGNNIDINSHNSSSQILLTAAELHVDSGDDLIEFNGGRLQQVGNPLNAQDAATKSYTDNLVGGLSWKDAVRVASTGDISVLAAPASIDDITLTVADRILLKNQATAAENGVYDFNGAGETLTRSYDMSVWDEVVGAVVFVTQGTTNIGSKWVNTNIIGGTIDVTSITFTAFDITGTVHGTASAGQAVYWTGTGTIAGENQLATTRGGLGADASGFTGLLKFAAGVASASTLVNADVNATANIDVTKLGTGIIDNTEFNFLNGVTSNIQTQINSITAATGNYVVGPASATDNAFARFDLTTGKLIQNSVVTATDAGIIAGVTQLNVDNLRLDGNTLSATDAAGNLVLNPGAGTANVQLNSATQIFYSTGSAYMAGGWAGSFNANPAGTGNVTISPGARLFYATTGVSGTPTSIRGISAPSSSLAAKSQFYYLKNQTGVDVPLTNEDSGATAADRVVTGTGASYIWKNDTVIQVAYDTDASRWRLFNGFINPITSSTDNAIARWDSTTGQLIQNSGVTISDGNAIAGITQLDVDNIRLDGNTISSTNSNGDIAIVTNGTGNVTLDTEKFRRSKEGTNFIEEEYIDSVTLTASSTVTAYSYTAASYTGVIVTYTVTSNAGEVRTGQIMISNKADGSTVTRTDNFNETADVGVTTSVDFSTPNIRLRVANANGTDAIMRLDIKLLRA